MNLSDLVKDPNAELLRAALQQVAENVQPMASRLGDVSDLVARLTSRMGFDVTIGGRRCVVLLEHERNERGSGRMVGVTTLVMTQPIPVSITVNGRAGLSLGTSLIALGDRQFASAFRTYGFPEDVVAEILDERTRTMLLERFDRTGRSVRRAIGWLSAGSGRVTRFVPIQGAGLFMYRITPHPEELRNEILETFAIADRLTNAWSRRYAEVAAREGPAAAALWQATKQRETSGFVQAKKRRSLVFVAIVLVVVLLLGGVIFAACVGFTLMHSDIGGRPLLGH